MKRGLLRNIVFLIVLAGWAPLRAASPAPGDTARALEGVVLSSPLKHRQDLRLEPLSSSALRLAQVEREQVHALRDFADLTPNLHIPDYGSSMTSSMYVRGLGSRMEHPSVGLYVDGVPCLNKNGFDTELWDIMRLEVLRGPQSTLYGRNTIGGILALRTLTPELYQGTRIRAGYGSGQHRFVQAATYQKTASQQAYSVGVRLQGSEGFFRNAYTGKLCDGGRGAQLRARYIWSPAPTWKADAALSAGVLDQGGYAYGLWDGARGQVLPVSYNDPSSYRRMTLTPSLTLAHTAERWRMQAVTSWQWLDDCMVLDQDFTPKKMFTLRQAQREHALTQEVVVRGGEDSARPWLCGLALFAKHGRLNAPVLFKEDGIRELILHNINQGIQQAFEGASLLFEEDAFEISSRFTTPVWGAAVFHQQSRQWGRWGLTAGLRLDYEHARMDYASQAGLHYRFTLTMPQFKAFTTAMEGRERLDFVNLLPKLALQYALPQEGLLYVTASRGFKAGGFNTQMFSDILQNRMQEDMMADLGVYFAQPLLQGYSVRDIITYKPEYSWNLEGGLHAQSAGGRLRLDAAVFAVFCRNQQLTIFPSGKGTGRMMTNAGRTRSLGAELEAELSLPGGLYAGLAWGYTHAVFTRYHNGVEDFAGRALPYVPRHTFSLHARYLRHKPLGGCLDRLELRGRLHGAGKIWWDEANVLAQPLYVLADASLLLEKGRYGLEFWGKNLGGTSYRTFYFLSVGNPFFALGKPRQLGLTLLFDF